MRPLLLLLVLSACTAGTVRDTAGIVADVMGAAMPSLQDRLDAGIAELHASLPENGDEPVSLEEILVSLGAALTGVLGLNGWRNRTRRRDLAKAVDQASGMHGDWTDASAEKQEKWS